MAQKMRPWNLLPTPLPGADDGEVQPNPLAMGQGMDPGSLAAQMYQEISGLKMPQGKVEQGETQNYKRSTNRTLMRRPEDIRAINMMKHGAYPAITGYEPATNEAGVPIPGVSDESRPMYDFSQVQQDETDPVYRTEKGLDSLQDLLGAQSKINEGRSTVDLRPLAKLADAWSRSNPHLSDNLEAPQNPANQIFSAADELQKRRGDLSKMLAQTNPGFNGGTTLDLLAQSMQNKQDAGFGGNGRQAIAQENSFLNRVSHESRDLRMQDQVLTNVSKLLSQGNPSADPEIKTQLARLIEGTVRPQMAVIGAAGGDPSFWQQLENRLTSITQGKLSPEQRGQYRTEIQALMETHNQMAAAMRASWAVQNNRLMNPFTDDDLAKIAGAATPGAGTSATALRKVAPPASVGLPKAPPKNAGAGLPSLDEIDAELARRKGGK